MTLLQISNWLVGIASGYTPPGALSAETVAGTIALSSFISIFMGMDKLSKDMVAAPIRTSIGLPLGTSLLFGSIFVIGHQVGTALRCSLKDQSERRKE